MEDDIQSDPTPISSRAKGPVHGTALSEPQLGELERGSAEATTQEMVMPSPPLTPPPVMSSATHVGRAMVPTGGKVSTAAATKKPRKPMSRVIPVAAAYHYTLDSLRPILTLHYQELLMTLFLFGCAYSGFLMRQNGIASFSLLNALAYFIMGIGWLGRSA